MSGHCLDAPGNVPVDSYIVLIEAPFTKEKLPRPYRMKYQACVWGTCYSASNVATLCE